MGKTGNCQRKPQIRRFCARMPCRCGHSHPYNLAFEDVPPARRPIPESPHARRGPQTGETVQVPVGIDPGFGHNVGQLNLGRDASDRLIVNIDAADEAVARAAIGNPWGTAMFRRFLAGASDGDWPVATLGPKVREAIGAQSRTVRLSAATAAKQARRRKPNLDPQDYARIQRILDEGDLVVQDNRIVHGFIEEKGRLWKTVVKCTHDRTENYAVTLHRAQPDNLRIAKQRYEPIDQGGRGEAPGGS